jgi:hypothetical protein
MEHYDIDAYVPAQMAVRVEKSGIVKSNRDFFSTFTLAMMAGVFIGRLVLDFPERSVDCWRGDGWRDSADDCQCKG